MRATEIIRKILDVIDQVEGQEAEQPLVAISVEPMDSMVQYANEPDEQYRGVDAVIASGTDVHHSKNPADIRTNAPSMFPGFQAGVK